MDDDGLPDFDASRMERARQDASLTLSSLPASDVDDAEPGLSETDRRVVRMVRAAVVRTAMAQGADHGGEGLRGNAGRSSVEGDRAGDATQGYGPSSCIGTWCR